MASCSTTQTVQSSFSSPCSKPQPENDVFLNFRGEDTRNNFTDHLYRALEGKRIKTFKDDTKLEPGNPISLKLLDAIEKSRIAVVILSKNYASSTWCLEELVKILECMEEGGLTLLPIFYHVDPSHVRNQKETFAVAFAEHENRFQKKQVQIWRNALSDVAKLSGKTLTNGPEGEFIQEIVDWIFTKLKDRHSIVYEGGLVGIASRVEEMNSVLDMNSNDVCFIGICGKSGMGKTTLARFVFDKIRNQFEACSFLENVKEVSKARGLETLQEQLLFDISKGAFSVRDESRGVQVIRNILRDKKVLIVVDDVSEKRHLEALAGKSWFGPRSRIIVTTDDECLLKSYKIQTVWADGLNNDEAQRLFSQKVHCEIDFLDLVNDLVTYAQGSPLVLKVLGSHLCKRTKEEWESARNQLKAIPNENILEKLQIAYNGLEELEKKLFLHIACFFKGEDQNRVAAILESVCYWDDNTRKLIDKSLITIVGGKLCMHHLIQQMGWKIVCGESVDLGRRSRLWDCTDVLYVLKNNIGTERIEGMVLNLPPDEEQEELNAEPFSNMNKLKLLKICKLHLPCLRNLSNELLLLEWHEYPLKSLPKSFQPPKLVELIMHRSNIKQLPSEFSNLPKLKLIDLSDSQNLCQTPNFNGLPNIERLIFQGCTGLHALHPSVGSLKRLILLNLKDCKCLENLPHEINLNSLEILILSGCAKLKKFPKIGRNMTSMLELYLDRTAIEELPSSIKHLTGLTLLNLQDCKNLSSFPSVICSLISLKILILSGCKGQPPKARYLSGLIPTLSSIGTALTLPYTYLADRKPELEPISLVLPESLSRLSSLESLDLSGCNLLFGALPDDLSYLSSLTSLNLRNNNFTRLPYSISQLLNLKLLFLDHCSKLQSFPYLPLSTQFVSAQGCTSLENYLNQVVIWTSDAGRFTFINCHGLADDEGKLADVPSLNTHFQSLWQRYMEDQIYQLKGFCVVVPQTEISEGFKNKECGSSVRIPLPPNLFNNRSWKGIALCVIFVVPPSLKDESPGQDSKYFHEFICHFDIDGVSLNCPLVLKVPKEKFVGSFGLWLYISHARFTEHSDEGSCIGSVIRPTRLDIQIKMCGAHILYEQDMIEFVQNSRPENFRSCNDLSRGHEKFNEDHMSSSQSSDTKLKQKLNSQLSTLYQVDWARNHLYDYIFHQIPRPPCWFNCNKLGPSIEMQLPTDVHDDSTWLGFTVYAFYCIQMRAGFRYKLDSTIFLRYSSLSASDEVSFAPCMAFTLSRDVFDESYQDLRRLVVFYIPCRVLKMNRCNHIGALFKSSDPAVQFEMCGIRLVYEKNVTKFVQTLVEYMLGSPDANHQSFSVHLSHQLRMLKDCNHEKDYRCPFLPERRPMRTRLPNKETTQEECTSRETFSNQVSAAGTTKNSSPGSINFGISFGNGQCGSKMSADSLECWFKPLLQNHHKCRSDFNCCSPQSEIPKCFTYQSNRSSMKIFLPSNLYNKPDWIGFAFSTVFSFNKNMMTADHMKQGSGFSLICHLKTNLGCMNPLFYHSIREEDVLTSLHQCAFLWESFISHQFLSSEWSECTWVEFSFVSDSLDVLALKCAVDLVYQHNLEDFTLTTAPSITSYNDSFPSNERLSFYHRDKFGGSDGLYEDQTNGTSSQYSYGGQHPCYQLYQTAALSDEQWVQKLVEMGFVEDVVRSALEAVNGDKILAVKMLRFAECARVGNDTNTKLWQPDEQQVQKLVEMGFAEAAMRSALEAVNGDEILAIKMLRFAKFGPARINTYRKVQVQSLKLQSKPGSSFSFPYSLNEMGVSASSSLGLIHPNFRSSDLLDEQRVEKLVEMGLVEDAMRGALKAVNGDEILAVKMLRFVEREWVGNDTNSKLWQPDEQQVQKPVEGGFAKATMRSAPEAVNDCARVGNDTNSKLWQPDKQQVRKPVEWGFAKATMRSARKAVKDCARVGNDTNSKLWQPDKQQVRKPVEWGFAKATMRGARKAVKDSWQSSVPSWEKEFCLLIGSVPWRKLLESKKCMYLYDNVVQWNDSAGEEAFCNAKKRYWAGTNGLPCNISLPDPDIYIDKVDWNSSIDPELLLDLEQEQETHDEVDKDEKVVILGDSFLNKSFSCTGWGEDEEELQKAADLSRHPGNEDWDRKVDNDNNPWENSNGQNNGAMKDYGWGSHPNHSQACNKLKNSFYQWENNYNGVENVDDRSGGNWGTYDDNSRKKQGSPRYRSRYKTSSFAGIDYQRDNNERRNGRGRKKENCSYVVDNKPASRQWNSCGYAIMDSGEQQFQ